ncbi:MAG TPA: KpsF/GutQ family sugar-phosphate isomerase [Bauldia sp.]|nr:KpsF/GutQ family sugar-phosphate isomerase [Bauldia sp.]
MTNPAKRKIEVVKTAPDSAAASALRTIHFERDGLTALAAALDNGLADAFAAAVDLIRSGNGRVIVSGLGKSGHIGRKIAATLASTGTPAFFVHPAEASHGDLGMITKADVILALSWSGETAELRSIVEYARRFDIALIAMTSTPESTLARESDIVLVLPKATEACPHGLAPTTSTLMQLALGDALAIALLESHGFTAESFHAFHPGGRLGASLHFVRAIMHRGDALPLVPLGTAMSEAIPVMTAKGFGCLGVVGEDGALVGILTDGDLRRSLAPNFLERRVDDVMNRSPKTISPDTLVGEALAMMNTADRPFTVLFVVEERRPIGIVHMHDFLRLGAA